MQPKNRILELFEPPMSLGDVIPCAVAYMERELKNNGIYVVYFGLQVLYNEKVSCSHHAPFGQNTNWGGKHEDRPKHYPGWSGRIWVGFSKNLISKGHCLNPGQPLARIGIHTGTGGGGQYNLPTAIKNKLAPNQNLQDYCDPWGWDVKIFLDDWPSLKILKILKPDNPNYRLTFNKNKTVFPHYVNAPWAPETIPRPKHNAKWLEPDTSYEPLEFII
jgi:hypothetical protein